MSVCPALGTRGKAVFRQANALSHLMGSINLWS